jgi:hypothetical protein
MRFLQKSHSLFIDDLPGLGNRVIYRGLPVGRLICPDKLDTFDFTI